MRSRITAIVVGAAVMIGGYAVVQGGGSPAGTANVWVDTSGGTCSRSSSAVAYDNATACESIADAWAAASAGDTIRVADGTYTTECSLSGDKASDTYIIGNGSATKLVCLLNPAGHLNLQDIEGYQSAFDTGDTNVTFTNVDFTCTDSAPYTLYSPANLCSAAITLTASNFTWTGGSVGPSYDSSDCGGAGPFSVIGGGGSDPDPMTITDVEWHTTRNDGCPSQHSEALRIDGGDNITIDRNYFHCGGTTGLVFVSTNGNNVAGGASDNLTIKNSYFTNTGGCADDGDGGTHAIDFNPDAVAGPPQNVHIINVVAHGALTFDTGNGNFAGSVIANTVWRGANPCPSGVATFTHNAPYQPDTGGTTDRCGGDSNQVGVGTQSNNAASPSSWFACGSSCATATPAQHTAAGGSPLINAGTNTWNPGSDFGGVVTRPCGGTVDIGIWESGC